MQRVEIGIDEALATVVMYSKVAAASGFGTRQRTEF
jgi:hypothetical protein